MRQIAQTRYDSFDVTRREAETKAEEDEDLQMYKTVAKKVKKKHE